MMKVVTAAFLAIAVTGGVAGQTRDVARSVAADAMVVDRVAEVSQRDLPRDLLKRIVEDDIDLLRGKRADGSFQFASWERFEAGRISNAFSIRAQSDRMETVELRGTFVYRVILDIPERRLLVRKNRPVWIERVDADFVGEGSTQSQTQSFDVKAWMQPGEVRTVELPVVARQATVKVVAAAEDNGGYGNVGITLLQARIVDNPNSPFAAAVAGAQALVRALGNDDVTTIRSIAQRMRDAAGGAAGAAAQALPPVATVRPAVAAGPQGGDSAARVEFQAELQLIEDLLTGSEPERRDGMDRLHQLIRKVRP